MKITVTDPKFTTVTRQDGVIEYHHPDATTIITSDYKVYNAKNGRELRVYQNEKLVGGQISSNFKGTRSNYSFARLLALMAGQPKSGYYRVIDGSKPLTLDNITTMKDHMSSHAHKDLFNSDGELKSTPTFVNLTQENKDNLSRDFDISINKESVKDYLLDYIPCEDNVQFITEDDLIFTDRSGALIHQLSVDKGKELANIVLKDKGGYALAEKIYLSQVHYRDGKPIDYNFKTILENDSGIKEVGDMTYLVDNGNDGVREFKNKDDMEKWIKAKALVDMVVDYRYNISKIAEMIK